MSASKLVTPEKNHVSFESPVPKLKLDSIIKQTSDPLNKSIGNIPQVLSGVLRLTIHKASIANPNLIEQLGNPYLTIKLDQGEKA